MPGGRGMWFAGVSAGAFALVGVGGGLGYLLGAEKAEPVASESPKDASVDAAAEERRCSDGSPCERFGKSGVCVRGVCVLEEGHCSRHIDCDDGRPCTRNECVDGACETRSRRGECKLDPSGIGRCVEGYCEPSTELSCATAKDCVASKNPCRSVSCSDRRCLFEDVEEGSSCRTAGGAPGECAGGACQIDPDRAEGGKRCRKVYDAFYESYRRVCKDQLVYRLSPEDRASAEEELEERIAEELHYDLEVRLVYLPDGGYNIVSYNERDRTDVRGLCDPSLVAFTAAHYTKETNWKSRGLQIWLNPGQEGWGISTSGSRNAVEKGRASSALGFLGVVDVEEFRSWLEKEFEPLDP